MNTSWQEQRQEIAVWLSGYLGMVKKWVDKILDNEDHDVDKNKILKTLDEWIKYADEMDKKQKQAPTVFYNHFRNKPGVGQGALWGGFYGEETKMKEEEKIEKAFEEAERAMTQAEKSLEEGKMSKKKYNKIKKKFDKASKEYTEEFGDENDEMKSWNDSFGIIQ